MKTRIEVFYRGRVHTLRLLESFKLSAQLKFSDDAINLYGAAAAYEEPLRYDDQPARVDLGGACNASRINLVPHCHGTHTECIGHVMREAHHVTEIDIPLLLASTLIHVPVERASTMKDTYNIYTADDDWVITAESISAAMAPLGSDYLEALIVATDTDYWLPDGSGAPYFSHQAMALIRTLGVQHLLVDLPSIDKLHDGGLMDNHRCFWGVSCPCHQAAERANASVTELIQVPADTPAGHYFISIQLPDIDGDALPSRPLVYPFL